MLDATILYYTGNLEEESFAEKIRQNILKHKGNLPIVSVSHKPIDFGKNICVGVQTPCYLNIDRQIQIGLNEIKTSYVLVANDDFLYPPDYFNFKPPEPGHCYRYFGVWVCYYQRMDDPKPYFHFKGFVDGAQMVDRKLYLKQIDSTLNKFLSKKKWASKNDYIDHRFSIKTDHDYTWTGQPVIDIKTKCSINRGTSLQKKVWPKKKLPYWGSCIDLRKRMFDA